MHQIHAGSRSLRDAAKAAPLEALGEVQIMPLLRRQVEITSGVGLQLRAANQFIRVSQQFQVEVRVFCNGHAANGRSILDLLCLAAECGDQLELEVSGPDAEDAASALCELIEARFHEAAHVRDESPNEGNKGHH
jgi:phosphocarrier protein HPr